MPTASKYHAVDYSSRAIIGIGNQLWKQQPMIAQNSASTLKPRNPTDQRREWKLDTMLSVAVQSHQPVPKKTVFFFWEARVAGLPTTTRIPCRTQMATA
jgi:hypothetical protein